MAIKSPAEFTYPLPHIAPIRTPGSSSLPLLIASSIALENFSAVDTSLREYALSEFGRLEDIQIVAPRVAALPHLFSVVADGVTGEYVVRELAAQGIDIDSGSACSPEDLQPSHVLAAMGYPTSGHLRFTLHDGVTREEISTLVSAVSVVVQKLRG
jgi:cysteine desulfurase